MGSPYLFLALIILSRIGLYGFSLAEVHIRQLYVRPHERGAISGFATAINYLMTLSLYSLALVISNYAWDGSVRGRGFNPRGRPR